MSYLELQDFHINTCGASVHLEDLDGQSAKVLVQDPRFDLDPNVRIKTMVLAAAGKAASCAACGKVAIEKVQLLRQYIWSIPHAFSL